MVPADAERVQEWILTCGDPRIPRRKKKRMAIAFDVRHSSAIMRPCGQVAQLVEQRIENPRVGGSIPSLATNKFKHLGQPLQAGLFAFWKYVTADVRAFHQKAASMGGLVFRRRAIVVASPQMG